MVERSPDSESFPVGVQVHRWVYPYPLSESTVLRFFRTRGLDPTRWSNGPGDVYGIHSHSYRKTLFCLEGSITFSLPEYSQDLELHTGDRLILPAGILHGAIVGPEGVTCIEAGI
jgi:quercetin dioxygenase-like cupin family protein